MHQGGQLQLGYIRTRPAHRHQAGREVSSHNARCWTTWETCRVCSAQRAEKHDGGRGPVSVTTCCLVNYLAPLCSSSDATAVPRQGVPGQGVSTHIPSLAAGSATSHTETAVIMPCEQEAAGLKK
jgi:hypothetical protein